MVQAARLQPGPISLESEGGGVWQAVMRVYASACYISTGLSDVAAALKLKEGDTICVVMRSPNRLLISKRGEPHFEAAADRGLLGRWPLTVTIASSKDSRLPLTIAAGSDLVPRCWESQSAVIMASVATIEGALKFLGYNRAVCQSMTPPLPR